MNLNFLRRLQKTEIILAYKQQLELSFHFLKYAVLATKVSEVKNLFVVS
jgi:hypothetical protein